MGTLSSELGPHADRIAAQPRMYVDANVPAGAVAYMRTALKWDVLFVVEDDQLRRARDGEHFRLARQLGRTLITLDKDYLDERRFPNDESGGVLVVSAPDEWRLKTLLKRFDEFIRSGDLPASPLPLRGRTLHIHVDWPGAVGERVIVSRSCRDTRPGG
jgi:hypothetical protein